MREPRKVRTEAELIKSCRLLRIFNEELKLKNRLLFDQLEAVLDTEVPLSDGKIKIRQLSQVQAALQQEKNDE
jgi:hypothetical protein